MAKLVWRVKLVAERHPGVTTGTELACIEPDAGVGWGEIGLRLDEAKRLAAALQAEMMPAQMAAEHALQAACGLGMGTADAPLADTAVRSLRRLAALCRCAGRESQREVASTTARDNASPGCSATSSATGRRSCPMPPGAGRVSQS